MADTNLSDKHFASSLSEAHTLTSFYVAANDIFIKSNRENITEAYLQI
jgi:hypothetical protein